MYIHQSRCATVLLKALRYHVTLTSKQGLTEGVSLDPVASCRHLRRRRRQRPRKVVPDEGVGQVGSQQLRRHRSRD